MAKKKVEVKEEVGEIKAVEVKVKKVKKVPYSLHAWFAYIDKEGFKVKSEYSSDGDTVAELLGNIKDFPAGVNRLVNVSVKHGEKEISKALAPHKARAILEKKNEVDFTEVFRGL